MNTLMKITVTQIIALAFYVIGILLIISNINTGLNGIYISVITIIYLACNLSMIYRLKKYIDNLKLHNGNHSIKSISPNVSLSLAPSENSAYEKIRLIVDAFENISKLNKEDFLKKIFDSAFDLIPEAEKGSFYEFNGDRFVPILYKGYDFELLSKLSFTEEEVFIGFECSDNNDIRAYEVYISKRDDKKFTKERIDVFKGLGTYSNFTALYAPIQVEGKNIGMICLERFNNSGFDEISKTVLKYYAQLISEFYTQRVYQEKKTEFFHSIVTALVTAIEVKDVYTEGHGQRVKKYSTMIAEKMKLSKDQIYNISIASLLHDVGKIGIPTEILNKTSSLTGEEYAIVKRHPQYSKKILERISGFSMIKEFTYAHHERYDGKGYPLGIKGDKIPLEAQVIQVADVFDALTSERSYRKALSKEEAIEIIKNEIGKQFHPYVAKVAIDEVFNIVEIS